jgi:hypothetical protein
MNGVYKIAVFGKDVYILYMSKMVGDLMLLVFL